MNLRAVPIFNLAESNISLSEANISVSCFQITEAQFDRDFDIEEDTAESSAKETTNA